MGNDEDIENMKNKYYLNVCLIGDKEDKQLLNLIQSFKIKNIKKNVTIKKKEDLNNIYDYWDWLFNFDYSFKDQCKDAFDFISFNKISHIVSKVCLVVNVNNRDSPEVKYILNKINEIGDKNYMPLTLFLCDNKIIFSKNDYPNIDDRIIFTEKINYLGDDYEINSIQKTLINFCSIYNRLGDKFTVGIKDREINYNLIDEVFPYNLNIACIGKKEKEKTSCINILLNEMRVTENDLDKSQINHTACYQVKNYPIKILNISNFENLTTIKNAVSELQIMQGNLFTSKEKLHIILYIIDSNSDSLTFFLNEEILLIKELMNYKESKIIYLFTNVTNSNENKNKIIEKAKISLFNLINQEEDDSNKSLISKRMNISFENSVFLNLLGNEQSKFGINELFDKINSFFKSTKSYKKSLIQKTQNDIEKEALELKEKAKNELLSNKIAPSFIKEISIIDLILKEKIFIKRNTLNRIMQIFRIDLKKIEKIKKDKSNEKILLEREINQERISLADLFKRQNTTNLDIKDYQELSQIINKDNEYREKKDFDISKFDAKFRVEELNNEIYLEYLVGIGLVYCMNKELNNFLNRFYNVYLKYGIFFKSSYLEASQYLEEMKTKYSKEKDFIPFLFILYILLILYNLIIKIYILFNNN